MYKNLSHKVDIWRGYLMKLSRRGTARYTGCKGEKHRIFLRPVQSLSCLDDAGQVLEITNKTQGRNETNVWKFSVTGLPQEQLSAIRGGNGARAGIIE